MISIILLVLAGIFNACMDTLKTHYSTSIFSKWKNQDWVNSSLSWTNKWKPESKLGDLIMSTVLVWVTNWWADFMILFASFTVPFELFYSKILVLKNK